MVTACPLYHYLHKTIFVGLNIRNIIILFSAYLISSPKNIFLTHKTSQNGNNNI